MGVDHCDGVMFDEGEGGRVEISLGSTRYWWPACEDGSKPVTGLCFEMLDGGMDFYLKYVALVGFDVRHSTVKKDRDGKVVLKYLVCSREGYKSMSSGPSNIQGGGGDHGGALTQKRRRVSNRVGCKARVVFKKYVGGGY